MGREGSDQWKVRTSERTVVSDANGRRARVLCILGVASTECGTLLGHGDPQVELVPASRDRVDAGRLAVCPSTGNEFGPELGPELRGGRRTRFLNPAATGRLAS